VRGVRHEVVRKLFSDRGSASSPCSEKGEFGVGFLCRAHHRSPARTCEAPSKALRPCRMPTFGRDTPQCPKASGNRAPPVRRDAMVRLTEPSGDEQWVAATALELGTRSDPGDGPLIQRRVKGRLSGPFDRDLVPLGRRPGIGRYRECGDQEFSGLYSASAAPCGAHPHRRR
jgi:hypothetical protein